MSYSNKIKNTLYWWLGRKPFFINDEYKLELLFIDKINNSAKIQITNLKSGLPQEVSIPTTETHNE